MRARCTRPFNLDFLGWTCPSALTRSASVKKGSSHFSGEGGLDFQEEVG
jgi:hypothetical protein